MGKWFDLLTDMAKAAFTGKLIFHFQHGKIMDVSEESKIKFKEKRWVGWIKIK